LTIEALAILTGERAVKAAKPLQKRAFKQSIKARKAMSDAKKVWLAAERKASKV
jgi:hypothetical protein